MAEQIDIVLKVVFDISTRPQTKANSLGAWLNPIEDWTNQKVTELVISAPVSIGAVAVESRYRLKVTDNGIGDDGERHWQVYPKRLLSVNINEDKKIEWVTHLDNYYRDLQAEIRTAIISAPVQHRAKILDWHLHLGGGIDEVGP